ncbi:MAG TPA: EEP domain-containing protein [Gammaproteobacteria bacterium]|nr:EEP domain-containing protein [Gammaproteobacteria bacterium]
MPHLSELSPASVQENVLSQTASGTRLRLLSYNIQVGISTQRPRHYLTKSWRHILPHSERFSNLDHIAHLLHDYDIVGLQEVDAGSLRSNFINLTEYLADKAGFPFWHHRVNRRLGKFAQHATGLLSRIRPAKVAEQRLPGLIPGRGFTAALYGHGEESLVVFNIHLALSRRVRLEQISYLADLINQYPHVILMGDMNCQPDSPELCYLFDRTRLREPLEKFHTFPSWQPNRNIDHILVTPELEVRQARVLKHSYSDHLPISMELTVPDTVSLQR